ncbi:leucine-rich repeat domain-containing protein [Parvimonas micra]|uniref:leucine-rich repeat domain-containing protein n=1 Tax=Parvimonas micra TaxID=33033 RepID=UPI0020042D99|nr:leucine-rich repeat domain-containing protein [Parvimonas micra]MCK6130710.1 leucine-rich repeat domain-containing protein [Parvimonas micra]MCK6136355.1 leucine-rich repeat domain-containing protein [Parvimonas micra]MCK6137826.1 leucine-rich repeat domain-containing protein [Parvimonas micra]MCK6154354.1 leucine-rich repeat domain-containing protein [Parvimonas micra]
MKNKNILALALLCGFSFSQVSFADSETVIYNKEGITVNLIADGEGTFKISVENKSSKDMVGVKVKTEDIKGLKIVKGKELEIGDVKVGEKKVLENEKIQFEVVEAIKDGIKKGKLSKTGIAGVYKINVTIAVAGIVGVICVLVSKKRNAKKLLSVAVGTGILMSSVLAYNSNAEGTYKNSANLSGNIEIKGKTYDYVGVLVWNGENSKVENDEQDKVVEIEDAKLLKVINKNLGKNRADNQKVTVEEMESLTELSIFLKEDGSADFSESAKYSILGKPTSLKGTKDFKFAVTRGMKSIKGLEYAKNLKKLKLNENEISDISPLKNLTKLEYLEIQRNRIVDVNPLKNLTNLKFLKLYNNLIEDIAPLSNLTNLTGLDLHYNVTVGGDESHKIISKGITDISALKNLKKLEFLDISANRIEDISILKNFDKIKDLDFSGNRVKNYEGLGDYIAERLGKALNEGIGSIQFSGQTIDFGSTVEVKGKEVIFTTPFKGIKELGNSLAQVFGSENPLNAFGEIKTNVEGIEASYDLDTNKIKLTVSDGVITKYNGKELDLNLKMSLEEYTWTLKNIKIKFVSE